MSKKKPFAKVVRAKFKNGRVDYRLVRVDTGRIISVFGSKKDALKKRDAINKFRRSLKK